MHIFSQLPDTSDTNSLRQEARYQENKTPPGPLTNLRCWYMNCRTTKMLVKYENALSVIYIYSFQFSLAPRNYVSLHITWIAHTSSFRFRSSIIYRP